MKGIYSTIALVLMASCSTLNSAQQYDVAYMEQMHLQPAQYRADFREVDSIVREKYTHIESKSIDMDSLYAIFQPRVAGATAPAQYGLLLQEYFAVLRNCHSMPLFKNYYLDFNVEMIEDRVLIKRIGSGVDALATIGVKLKDEILAVDGMPISQWIDKNKRFISASTDRGREHYTAWSIKSSYSEQPRRYTINTESGVKEITLNFCEENNLYSGGGIATIEQRIIADSVGYIAINTMGDSRVVELFAEAYKVVESLPYLIVDVRNNGGGISSYSESIAEYLIAKPQEASVSRRQLQPAANYYRGKLFVMTDVGCGSAAESFVLDLKESGNAILVGMATAGDTGNSPKVQTTSRGTIFNIPTRESAQISPQGFPMEGVGIEPHHRVEITLSDYLADIDTQLEYVLKLIDCCKISR